jgi:hypothetical protein
MGRKLGLRLVLLVGVTALVVVRLSPWQTRERAMPRDKSTSSVTWNAYPKEKLRAPISRGLCKTIERDMTPEQVRAIMGCPQGYYYPADRQDTRHPYKKRFPDTIVVTDKSSTGFVETWADESAYIQVGFLQGKVIYALFGKY